MERKIGEIFEYRSEWYQCVGGTCRNCSFYYDTVCKNITTIGSTNFGNCHCSSRTDHKSVIFKKLEKVGEPYRRWLSPSNNIMVQRYRLYGRNVIMPDEPCMYFNAIDNTIEIELKQNKEDMEEKKLNLKPFDIQKAREGKPVCTRDGKKARIICFDSINKGNYPIIALIEDKGYESLFYYNENGESNIGTDFNLMMPPEKHEGWVNIYKLKSPAYKDFPYACLLSPTKNGAISIMDSNDLPSSSVELFKNLLVDDVLKDNPLIATVRIEWEG